MGNVRDALIGFPVKSLYAWLDSSVALHWIRGSGEYKQFVSNRVRKIREKTEITWRHVPSQENPSDLASRGGLVLAQWDKRRSVEREAAGSSPGRTNTQGL